MAADSPAHHEPPGPGDGPGGSVILDQAFDGGSLYALRSAVGAHATAAGLDSLRVYDVVTTAHELAANAVRHGAGRGRLRLHADGPLLYCQVSDDGPPAKDGKPQPSAGVPPWPSQHGHGLWLIAQVADWLSIDHGPAGTTATARFTISPSPAGDEATTAEDKGRPPAAGGEAGNPR